MKSDATDIAARTEWHERTIPDFVGPALAALYGSLYSSLPQLALGTLGEVSTYAARSNGRLQALFLFTRKGRNARVINEGMSVSGADATRFAAELFARFAEIDRVEFHAIDASSAPPTRASFCFTMNEDIVIDLPDSEAAYLARLGKSTRKTLRQNLARAQGLVHEVLPGCAVEAALVDRIIAFNHARLAAKQRCSALDASAAQQLLALVRAQGMAGTIHLNGRLCAGTLACRIGDEVHSLVNAHDPAVDHLGMGNLCRHLMIVAAIRSGARRFHLLGGNFGSKRSCAAERRPLQHWVIYRHRWSALKDLPHLAALACVAQRYRLSLWLDSDAADTRGARLAQAMAATLRQRRSAVQRRQRPEKSGA